MFSTNDARFVANILAKLFSVALIASVLALIGCGGGSAMSPAPPPTAKAKFAYTANQNSGNLSGYAVDPSTGVLTPLAGFPVASGVNPVSVIHDPPNRFAIVADIAVNLITVYGINQSTGMLTKVQPSPYLVGQEPRSLAIDPSGKFVYVASQALNNVTAFSMNASGVLTPVPGSPFPTGGTGPSFGCCVLVHPTGKFLYVEDLNNVYAFSIAPSTGALTLLTTISGPSQGGGLALDPAGTFLYAE
jgi:6-phosphogluconolactonase (cycloisomerase 2 family)